MGTKRRLMLLHINLYADDDEGRGGTEECSPGEIVDSKFCVKVIFLLSFSCYLEGFPLGACDKPSYFIVGLPYNNNGGKIMFQL